MNTQDKRFLAAVLGDGCSAHFPDERKALGSFTLMRSIEWPFPPHAGIRSFAVRSLSPPTPPYERLILSASWGGDIAGTELSVGLDLALEPHETNDVFGKSEHLIGQLVAPETAPAKQNTVQIDFAERLPPGTESFGLAKLRGRILWQAGARHILRLHRQMPTGWPEPPHVETDESALTGRIAICGAGSSIRLGIPILTPDRRKVIEMAISDLTPSLAWLRENAG